MVGQRICIIGGSGFVGRAVAKQALAAGHQVKVGCRHPERARDMIIGGVRLARVDVVDGRGVDEAVEGCDVVIYLVGLLFERGRYNFQAAHVAGVEHVLAACRRAGVGQYLHMSALGAGAVPDSSYASSKGEAEVRVRACGLNWTIFRPSIIYGAGDSFFNKFKAMSDALPMLPVIRGATRFQLVWVEDVARAFVTSIGNRHTAGQCYELGGPGVYSFEQLLQMMLDISGRKRLLLRLPGFIVCLLAAIGSFLPTPPLSKDQLILLAHDNVVSGDAFPARFGVPASLEDVLPTFIFGNQAEALQQQMDVSRQRYRKGGV